MLVLTRKVDERVIIGETIKVQVLAIKGNMVRLGIAAPPDVSVHREEVFEAIQREREEADGDE